MSSKKEPLDRNLQEPAQQPRTATEQLLSAIWEDVLRTQEINMGENFLALGGQSILATSIINRVREEFGVEVSVKSLLGAPATIQTLSTEIDKIIKSDGDD